MHFHWLQDFTLIANWNKVFNDLLLGRDLWHCQSQGFGPAVQRLGKSHAVDGNLGPAPLGENLVGDAGRGEDEGGVVQCRPELVGHSKDVVPLIGRVGKSHVVGVELKLVKLPLKDEKWSCKLRKKVKFETNFASILTYIQ